jgi:fructose-1,6-bisphosphatase/inositol monophosphatase family enzyme
MSDDSNSANDRYDLGARLLTVALEAAGAAGSMLVTERPAELRVAATKSSPVDVVTEMDTRAEKLIVDLIRSRRPHDGFLGEEGAGEPGTSGVRWVIDPVDGTVNYLYGLPGWAVSISAELDGEPLAGAVAIPTLGETFHAVRGGGAFCNGAPVSVNPGTSLEQALIGTGFGYLQERRVRQAAAAARLLAEGRDIRRLGAAAADLCHVACGRLDAYFERGLNPWDKSAGMLIVREAGGLAADILPQADGSTVTLAAAPGTYGELESALIRFAA